MDRLRGRLPKGRPPVGVPCEHPGELQRTPFGRSRRIPDFPRSGDNAPGSGEGRAGCDEKGMARPKARPIEVETTRPLAPLYVVPSTRASARRHSLGEVRRSTPYEAGGTHRPVHHRGLLLRRRGGRLHLPRPRDPAPPRPRLQKRLRQVRGRALLVRRVPPHEPVHQS